MFGTIRKHQTWLWLVIITGIIISFVWYFSPTQQMGNPRAAEVDLGSINGERVTEEDYVRAQREMAIQFFLRSGRFPTEDARRMGFDIERETYQWLLLQQKAREMGIVASPEAVEKQARQIISSFQQQSGIGSASAFFNQVLRPQGMGPEDFERFLRNYIALQELISVVGVSGKTITPAEAQALYERENQPVDTKVVFFSGSNYLDKVTMTPEALTQYFSNRLAVYRIPDRVVLNYVAFPVSNYMAQAEASFTNLNEMVEMNLARIGTNAIAGATTPEEKKAAIRKELLQQGARMEARKAATEFIRPLFDKEKVEIGDLAKAAQEKGLNLQTTAPFNRENGPSEIDAGPDLANVAFKLTPEEPLARPQIGMDAVYVVGLNRKVPSEIPPLDQVRQRVESDYRSSQAQDLARQAGRAFAATVTNALAQGTDFDKAAEQAQLKVTDLPPFSISARSLPGFDRQVPPQQLQQLKQLAFSTKPGQATPFEFTQEGGLVLFVEKKLPVDAAKMQTDMTNYVAMLRRARTEETFNSWFRREMERGLRDTPLNRPETPEIKPVGKAPADTKAPAGKAQS